MGKTPGEKYNTHSHTNKQMRNKENYTRIHPTWKMLIEVQAQVKHIISQESIKSGKSDF